MSLLSLDIATKTGWCTPHASGVQDFKLKRGESQGMMGIKFRSFLIDICKSDNIKLISYEQPSGIYKASIIHQSKLIGVLETFCIENNIDFTSYPAKTIKKFATGKGNASKSLMVAEAMQKFPDTEIIDDNHADAIWLYELTKSDLNL